MLEIDLAKLRRLREAAELSLEDAARRAGFSSRQQWHLIESGQRSNVRVDTLGKIAAALGVPPCELLLVKTPGKKKGA